MQRETEKIREESIRERAKMRRDEIFSPKGHQGTSAAERKTAAQIVQMEKVADTMNAKALSKMEREALRTESRRPLRVLYAVWLADQLVIEKDQARLRLIAETEERERERIRKKKEREERDGARSTTNEPSEKIAPPFDFKSRIEADRSITYLRSGKEIIRDADVRVFFLGKDDESMEAFVRLCAAKYPKLQFFGSPEFVGKAIQTAVDKGIKLTMGDAGQAEQYRVALEKAKDERERTRKVPAAAIPVKETPKVEKPEITKGRDQKRDGPEKGKGIGR